MHVSGRCFPIGAHVHACFIFKWAHLHRRSRYCGGSGAVAVGFIITVLLGFAMFMLFCLAELWGLSLMRDE